MYIMQKLWGVSSVCLVDSRNVGKRVSVFKWLLARRDSNSVCVYLRSTYVHLLHLRGSSQLYTDATLPLMIGVSPTYLYITHGPHKANVYGKGAVQTTQNELLLRIEDTYWCGRSKKNEKKRQMS